MPVEGTAEETALGTPTEGVRYGGEERVCQIGIGGATILLEGSVDCVVQDSVYFFEAAESGVGLTIEELVVRCGYQRLARGEGVGACGGCQDRFEAC